MILLKNHREFSGWKKSQGIDGLEKPKEYPCFAHAAVVSWDFEESAAVFYYRADLETMLRDLAKFSKEGK